MQPDLITADMRDYQLEGLNWMAHMHQQNMGMILGDEMGLGKTLQTISLICHIKETCHASGPSVVLCPLSVLYSWCNEIEKWAPSLKFLRFHSSNPESLAIADVGSYDIIVTTYEMAKAPALQNLWSRQHFNLLVLDEGHKIKNRDSQISAAVRKIHTENRIILTGTPLANNLVEMWSLLNFLAPDVFTVSEPFAEAFNLTLNVVDPEKLALAHHVLKIFMLRRLKSEVEKLMPKKVETKVRYMLIRSFVCCGIGTCLLTPPFVCCCYVTGDLPLVELANLLVQGIIAQRSKQTHRQDYWFLESWRAQQSHYAAPKGLSPPLSLSRRGGSRGRDDGRVSGRCLR
jgi:SNF2 family DNA or RNA helicase